MPGPVARILAWSVVAALAGVLGACGSDAPDDTSAGPATANSPAGETAPPSPSPRESTSAAPTPLNLSGPDLVGFTAEGGRVACLFTSTGAAVSVRCDVPENTWSTPAKPADCQGDWGLSAGLTVGEPGQLLCISDTVAGLRKQTDGSRELNPGTLATYGPLACLIQDTGVSCYDTTSGGQHSLFVNAHTYEVI